MSATYVGIDVNLTGYGLAIIAPNQIKLDFISFNNRDTLVGLENFIPEWVSRAKELCAAVMHFSNYDDIIIAIEDPTAMGAINLGKPDNRGMVFAKPIRAQTGSWAAAAALNKMVGILSVALDIPVSQLIYPSSVVWKKKVCGNGKADKKEVMLVTSKRLLGHEDVDYFKGNHHISDSMALAMHAEWYDSEAKEKKGEDDKEAK